MNIRFLISEGSIVWIKILLLSVANPVWCNSMIGLCLIEGRELVRILLAAGADPTMQDYPHCRTALHTAAMINDVELVKVKASVVNFPNTSLLFVHAISK
jgi:hypothetical protein